MDGERGAGMTIHYALTENPQIVVRSDGVFIPSDPTNSDYAAYCAWRADGNTPTPYTPPPAPVPQSVSRRQFFQAAAQIGIITEDEALATDSSIPAALLTAISSLPVADQFAAKMAVKFAQEFQRSNSILAALASAMGKTAAEIDALFALAATL